MDVEVCMLSGKNVGQVYLARESTDLRKSIDGLAVLVKEAFVIIIHPNNNTAPL
ncbi:IS66 family insertion sequence element accessory protein TnpB [Bacillus smithii]|uniref:IS66 family insertion sequence element accessory protein TnpB n=1 Tax=Bacillus smithii TaxID=1479 RepID=UPI002E243DE0|nr:IS66 family insertion sequence element accessory protein TnpB [Bacillus smithii]MED4928742.1 IS66 family insertion sequence element accessory protein TnpB [Bacillus smithii]